MEAVPTSTVSSAGPVSSPAAAPPRPRAPEPSQVGSTAQPALPEHLASPALPAAVQRTHLDPPPPKLMSREQMAALLLLAVGGA